MARTQGPSPRLQRLGAFAATALLAAATAVAFGRVFATGSATLKLLATALASAAVAAAFERRNLLLATGVSAALMIVAVGALVLPWTTWHGLPTLTTLKVMADSAALVGQQARLEVAPTAPLPPLMLAAVTAIWAAIFSAHALAFRASSPLLALLPPVALLAFADTVLEETFRPGFGLLFLAAALGVVFVDGLRRVQRWGPLWSWPGSHRRVSPATTRGAGRVAAGALAVATLAPLFLPGIGTKGVIDLSSAPGADVLRIDPQVAIASALKQDRVTPVFTVQTDHPTYYRMLALDSFDGNAWRSSDPSAAGAVAPGGALAATPPGASTIDQRFSVEASVPLSLPGVPVAYPPVSVTIPDQSVSYDDALQSVYLSGDLEAGTTYRATSLLQQPSPADLETYRLPPATAIQRWIALPNDAQTAQIRELAQRWTQAATTPYDQVLAILSHLSTSEGFQYDPAINQRGDDTLTLLKFLTDTKKGFCQQFASAMAVLLRSLRIPARVAMGFTQGQYDVAGDRWAVTSKDAHSWVEVDFGNFGWLTFDPTPGRSDPVSFGYGNVAAATCALQHGTNCDANDPATPTAGARNPQTEGRSLPQAQFLATREGAFAKARGHPRGSGVGGAGGGSSGPPFRSLAALGLLLVLLVLALIPPARALRRRARLRRASGEPRRTILATYDVFTDRAAELGLARRAGETPDEYRLRLAALPTRSNGELEALTRLAIRAAYAQADPGADDADQASRAAREAIRQLRRGTPLRRRVVGAWFPER